MPLECISPVAAGPLELRLLGFEGFCLIALVLLVRLFNCCVLRRLRLLQFDVEALLGVPDCLLEGRFNGFPLFGLRSLGLRL